MKKLLEIQKKIKPIEKDATNPYFNSKYFDINAILAELKPLLNELNLVLVQPVLVRDGKTILKTEIWDAENNTQIAIAEMVLPDIQDPQKLGSAITYFRRYSLQALLALEAVDDDANSAIMRPKIDFSSKKDLTDDQYKGTGRNKKIKLEPKHKDVAVDSVIEEINNEL